MQNIPYYDFSVFPLKSNIILKKIDLAINKGFKVIIINFGSFFPWTADKIIRSDFAYSDKLIDKIVNICRENSITLIPVLSILNNSDFILKDYKYKYLIDNGMKRPGLDVSSCGAGKLAEDLIDDIYSLMVFSEFLIVELPDLLPEDSIDNWSEFMNPFIKRISKNLSALGKTLILDCMQNSWDMKTALKSEGIRFISKNQYKKINIYHSNSYNLNIFRSKLAIDGTEYRILKFSGTDEFDGGLDIGNIIPRGNNDYIDVLIKTDLQYVDNFYSLLDDIWFLIRICWEELSLLYRNSDPVYRIKFCRSVQFLNKNYHNLKTSAHIVLDTLEGNYQSGALREWVNIKKDSVLSQLNKLENIAKPMGEGK